MPFDLGKEICLELLESDDGLESFLLKYDCLVDLDKTISWRSLYEQSRWWEDLSTPDLEYINAVTDAAEDFLRRVEQTRTHFGLRVLPEFLSSIVAKAQDFLVFLKKRLAYNLLLTKDDEASRTKALPTKVALETLEKKDRECFICTVPFREEKDGIVEDVVETPGQHKSKCCRVCVNKWFVQENHTTCPTVETISQGSYTAIRTMASIGHSPRRGW